MKQIYLKSLIFGRWMKVSKLLYMFELFSFWNLKKTLKEERGVPGLKPFQKVSSRSNIWKVKLFYYWINFGNITELSEIVEYNRF